MPIISTGIPPNIIPIDPRDFADLMEKRIKSLNPAFYCGGKIREGFIQFGSAYNYCIYLNGRGILTQIVIPAATGSGKSVSAKLELSQIAKIGMSGLLVVSEVAVAIEAAETINDLAGKKVAGVFYSVTENNPKHKLWCSIDSLPRITVITHAMFIQRSDSGKDIEELRKFQMECNEKLLEWEKENNIKVGCVLIPVGIKDNQAKMVVESRLWFEKI